MTFFYDPTEVNFDASYDYSANIETDFDTDVTYESSTDIDASVDVCVDVDGNLATFNVDVQAFGSDTAVEVNLVAFTNESYSSITLTGFSATD